MQLLKSLSHSIVHQLHVAREECLLRVRISTITHDTSQPENRIGKYVMLTSTLQYLVAILEQFFFIAMRLSPIRLGTSLFSNVFFLSLFSRLLGRLLFYSRSRSVGAVRSITGVGGCRKQNTEPMCACVINSVSPSSTIRPTFNVN